MGGENCWVPGCGSSRNTPNMYFWKIPCTSHPEDVKWRKNIEAIVCKYRVVDQSLLDRLEKGKIFTCEKHFKDEDFEYTPSGRKKVKLYILPTVNLPAKTHESTPPTPTTYTITSGTQFETERLR